MAAHKQALSFALAWFLLAGLFLTGEATNSRCKQKQVRERKPTLETLRWQEACLPLAVLLGGCCGLVWWVLLIIYDISQKGGQKGLPQISGEAEMEGQKTTNMDYLEEWSEEGIKLHCKAASKENVSPLVELGPRPPSQPKEQGPTTFWAYLEQELERILLAVRRHRTTGQNPVIPPVVEVTPPVVEVIPSAVQVTPPAVQVTPPAVQVMPPAVQVTLPAVQVTPPAVQVMPPAAEKPSTAPGDWQGILDHIKNAFSSERQSSPAVDKQQPLPGEGPSSRAVEKQSPPPEQRQSSPPQDQQRPPSEERQSSGPAKERKKSPKRPRSRSKRKSPSPPRVRGCNCPPRNRGRRSPSRNRGRRSPSRSRGCSSGRRRPCSKHK